MRWLLSQWVCLHWNTESFHKMSQTEKKGGMIGRPVPRKEGREKVTGDSRYIDDLKFPDMLYGATVRSTVPRGRITGITFDSRIDWSEFTIVTAADVPGHNFVALILEDQPYLADDCINHPEEPVVLIAHPDKYMVELARRAISIEVEVEPAIFTMEESLSGKEIIWGTDNVFKSFRVEKGNIDDVWESAFAIVEG